MTPPSPPASMRSSTVSTVSAQWNRIRPGKLHHEIPGRGEVNYRAQDKTAFGGAEGWSALNARLDDLVGLGGRDKINNMLSRFADQLDNILQRPRIEWSTAGIHRMIGLAGILGFAHVERTWRPIEDGAPTGGQLDAARAAAEAAIAFVTAYTS